MKISKDTYKLSVVAVLAIVILAVAGIHSFAFNGPGSSGGSGNGAIGVGGGSNISIGTSTPAADTMALIVGSTTNSSAYGLKVLNSAQTTVAAFRNDGNVGIGTASPGQKLDVNGNINVGGIIYGQGSQTNYGAITIRGTKNGWSGINFQDAGGTNDKTLMVTPTYSGIYNSADNAWSWYWNNGTLEGGTVPAANIGAGTLSGSFAMSGNLTVGGGSGKITAGSIDPPYTIGGDKYATYVSGMTGQKEETTGNIMLTKGTDGTWHANIDFTNAEKGSDLWLFGQVANLKDHLADMTVLLTPSFDGRTWYTKDAAHEELKIHATPADPTQNDLEVSYRLSAPRFDSAQWPNTRTDDVTGFVIN